MNKFFFSLLLLTGLSITACVDNDFDAPENTFKIEAEDVIDVADVLALISTSGPVTLDSALLGGDTKYISANITADDASGNFFKTLTFQDETGALSIIADRNELNAEFPQGNIVYIKLNELILAYDAGTPRLGYAYENGRLQRIPDILVNDFMIPGGTTDVAIAPEEMTITQFKQNPGAYLNKLVILKDVEFTLDFAGQTYADANNPDGPQSTNAILRDCDDNEIIVRNSGFADFATETIPVENGDLIAIASVFVDDLQLFIRDLSDVSFTEERCDGSGGQADNEITIQSIQDRFYDLGADNVQEGYISGVVISDKDAGQVNNRNIYIQNGEDGILIRFSAEHNYDLGDELRITVSDRELSEFNSLLQINEVPIFNVMELGTASLPDGKELEVSEILANNNTYESTRVLIKGATLSSDGTFAGDVNVDDGTADINIFTWNNAAYADEPVPTGTVDVIAIVSEYQGEVQLIINGPGDIVGGTVDPGSGNDGKVNQDFQGFEDFEPVDFDGWINVATKGDRVWYTRSFDDNGFAECEAFQDTNPETEAWLITPTIDTDEKSMFSFETAQAFWQHQGLSVWISQDFDNEANANWIEMDDAYIATQSDEQYTFVPSGEIDLTDYLGGKVRVGFKYEGTAAANTTKMRIDNIALN